jgi:hypothetical protein
MNNLLLNSSNLDSFDLNPRLRQYVNALNYHNANNIRPPITLRKQFSITKNDEYVLRQYFKQIQKSTKMYNNDVPLKKPITKCVGDSCNIYPSVKDEKERNTMGTTLKKDRKAHPYTYDDKAFAGLRDSHPYMYNNDYIVRRSPYTSDTHTINRVKVEVKMDQNSKNIKGTETINSGIGCNTIPHQNLNKNLNKNKNNGHIGRTDNNQNKTNFRRKVQDQPLKFVSTDFVRRDNDDNNSYYKKGGHIHGEIVDFDSLLRHGQVQDRNKTKIVTDMDVSNKWLSHRNTECKKVPNAEQAYLTTPYMGHGKGIGNVDVESTMWHAEPSRIAGSKDLGGVSINRFEDLFVDVQENSVYPFDFPRGGVNSRDPQLYVDQPPRII